MSDKSFRNLLLLSAVVAAMTSAPAMADPFLVNETVIPGTQTLGNADLSADQITFNYVARVNQSSPIIGGTGAFTESGFFLKNTFVLNNTPVASPNYSLLNFPEAGIGTGGVGAGAGYRLYGIFNIGGTATPSGTDIVANFQTMSLTLYVDPKQDDSFDFGPPASPVNGLNLTATATDPSGDDQALLTETLVEGRANIRGALNNGDYKAILNVTPTALGSKYFISPLPFFSLETFAGNTGTLNPAGTLTQAFTSTATGDGSETFSTTAPPPTSTPEPASLALLGSGLLGIGVFGRRRRSK